MRKHGVTFRLIVVVALLAAIVWLGLHREFLQAAILERQLERFGRWAPIVFMVLYALGTVLFVPGSVLTLAGGVLFGPVAGTLWNLTGATVGATLAFMIARYVASDWVAARSGERLGRLMRGVEEEGWRFVAFVRLVPLFPFNLMNYAFGLTRIRLRDYVLTSFVCMAPGALAYTYLGYAGREAVLGQSGAIRKAVLALALLAAVAFLPRLIRRLKGQRYTDPATLKRRLESGEEVALIDVRSADEFSGPLGHVPGALNIALAELLARVSDLSGSREKPIVVI
jgi:uncharacterized membrane protein YdjX (TVP38/TMEM64 family)